MRPIATFVTLLLLIGFSATIQAQDWKSYTWDDYSTSFQIPADFVVSDSSATKFTAANSHILMSIYPRTDEYLTWDEMGETLKTWSTDNGVLIESDVIELDEEKMNGYQGVLIEGTKDDYAIGTMLIVDPDYVDISLYIWVSYDPDYVDTVIEMLMSFTPM
jgi:hypothetical protein